MPEIKCLDHRAGKDWTLYNGDCVEVVRQLPSNSVDLAVFSPPFANVYTYSDSPRDMGNCDDYAQFIEGYSFLVAELLRVLRPGRMAVVHCKDVVRYKGSHGRAGLADFPGMLIRAHEEGGFQYHSRCTLWRDPVTEMQKTKAHGLLWMQLRKDSTFSRMGLPEYLLMFRKWAEDGQEDEVVPVTHTKAEFPVEQWQQWASPVWMDVRHTDTLNVAAARDDQDEKHMCPLSLDVIHRAVVLYSNPGEVVLSPFAGVGSEGVGALREKRRFVGVELKPSYFQRAAINLADAEGSEQLGLFGARS